MQVIKCNNVSQLPAPHCVRWAVSGATTGLALVFLAAFITGQFSTEATDIKGNEESDEPKQPRNNYVFTTIEGKTVVLSEFDVHTIKQMNDDGVFPSEIAKKFKNISIVNLYRIINCINSMKLC
jgi:hypothetical protein